jgi:DNA-binding MarR family transcriptional regulator
MMKSPHGNGHTPEGALATELILAVFRLNGSLLRAGDGLVADLGLSSARWQVLGAIGMSVGHQPVANLAREMGLTRQAVQRVADELESEGFVAYRTNPHHRRAKFVVLTERGSRAFQAAAERQSPWINALMEGLSLRDIRCALKVARALDDKLNATEAMSATSLMNRPRKRNKTGDT